MRVERVFQITSFGNQEPCTILAGVILCDEIKAGAKIEVRQNGVVVESVATICHYQFNLQSATEGLKCGIKIEPTPNIFAGAEVWEVP
jgi:translation initiation factor IF-2